MAQPKQSFEYRGKKGNENAVKSTDGDGHKYSYKPSNKEETEARQLVWKRYKAMRDHPLRKEAEKRWDLGDKMYRMWAPDRDPEDWRADIILPDGFSAIQTHMQETIDLRPRPILEGVEESDQKLEGFGNAVFQHAMNVTEFDEETFKARQCAAIRGDAFTIEEYRFESRTVQWPTSVDAETKEIKYEEKEMYDWDDVYTRHVDNWSVFFDPVEDPKYANDQIYREVISHEEFMEMYDDKDGFENIDEVCPAKAIHKNAGYFEKAEDIDNDDVELLHYWNKLLDRYIVLCNNVVVRDTPLPSRHKQLPIDWWAFYWVPGQSYGLGIPQIIYSLVEERRSLRNMGLDRQKMHLSKMFLTNDLFEIDEDDLTPRPHGLIRVNTNGMPLNQVIQPLEYGDQPVSSIHADRELKEDQRRAHGMDELNQAVGTGSTATEAAILDEATQKRINLINTLLNWRTLKRLGQKKWSNIQFFYPGSRMERILIDGEWQEKEIFKTIKVQGKEFKLMGDNDKGNIELREVPLVDEAKSSRLTLNGSFSKYLQYNFDVTVDAAANVVESKAVKQGKMDKMMDRLMGNPVTMRHMDAKKVSKRYIQVYDEAPSDWMMGDGATDEDMKALAGQENKIFAKMNETGEIFTFPGTPNATQSHTEEHLNFAETEFFSKLPQAIQDAFRNHVMEEIGRDPSIDLGGGKGGQQAPGGGPPQGGGGNATPPGMQGGPAVVDPQVGNGPVTGGDVTNAR